MNWKIKISCVLFVLTSLLCARAENTLFTDSFEGQNGQRPEGWNFDTSDPAFWNIQNGWLTTGNGDDLITQADGYSFGVIEIPGAKDWKNFQISCRFWMTQANGHIALVGRWSDRLNHYRAVLEVYQGRHIIKIVKVVRGQATTLESVPINLKELDLPSIAGGNARTAMTFAFSLDGDRLSAGLNGQVLVKARDLELSKGTAGVGQRLNEIFFDDLKVSEDVQVLASGAPSSTTGSDKIYSVQILSSKDLPTAQGLMSSLRQNNYRPFLVQDKGLYKVYLGRFSSHREAQLMQIEMGAANYHFAAVKDVTASDEIGKGAAAPKTSAISPNILKDLGWDNIPPSEQKKIMQRVYDLRAKRMEIGSAETIQSNRQKIEALDETLKKLLNRVEDSDQSEQEVEKRTRSILARINKAQDLGEYDRALASVQELKTLNPDSPLIDMKTNVIRQRQASILEDAALKTRIADLKTAATAATNQNDLNTALNKWELILSQAPHSDQPTIDEATSEIARIRTDMNRARDEKDNQARAATVKNLDKRYLMIGGGVFGALLLLIIIVIIANRRRYSSMLLQLQEEAITPLRELQQRGPATAIASNVAASDIEFSAPNQDLLEQTETSDAEFMIPETDTQDQLDDDPFGSPFDTAADDDSQSSPFDIPGDDDQDDEFALPDAELTEAPPAFSAEPPATPGDDDNQPQETSEFNLDDQTGDEIVFNFDETDTPLVSEETTTPPVTATEVSGDTEAGADDIVFSFDDIAPETAPQSAPPKPAPAPADAPADESIYESIPLGDLNLDLDTSAEDSTAGDTTGADSPFAGGMDLDFNIELPADDQTGTAEIAPNPLMGDLDVAPSTAAPGATLLQQNYDADQPGAIPAGWNGATTSFAALTTIEDPSDPSQKCMQFKKTAGDGPTDYTCKFPNISGKISVELDLRCDEKNKHLLGFYIEADADFRRSVHTVVQCTDPSRPAHLRIFTKPTPYQLATWQHIKYTIDLNEGIVDGYVDNKLIAEGIRMGTKTPILNTLSIRDNSETTGTLLIKNLTITQEA